MRGFVCWTVDMEGYGRSGKERDICCDIADGAHDLAAATEHIIHTRGIRTFMVYGISSGALRAALFAQRHPDRVSRLALDAFVWTGKGAPTLEQRRKKLPEFLAATQADDRDSCIRFLSAIIRTRRNRASSMHSPMQFSRSDDSMPTAPTSTCAPSCRSSIRQAHDANAHPARALRRHPAVDDLIEFFKRAVASGQAVLRDGRFISHASFQQKNY